MRLTICAGFALCLVASNAWAAPNPTIRESVAVCDPNNPTTCQGNTAGVYSAQLPLSSSAAAISSGTWASPKGGSTAPTVLVNGMICKAPSTNAGTVYVGPSGVSSSNGYPLAPGEAISWGPVSTASIYALDSTNTDILACTGS